MNKFFTAVAAAGLLAGTQAQATLIAPPMMLAPLSTSSDQTTSASVSVSDGSTSATLQIAKFNAALGTLTGISFSGTGSLFVTFGGDNNGADDANVWGVAAGTLSVLLPTSTMTFSLSGKPYETVLRAGTGLELADASATGSAADALSLPADLSAFIGSGLLNVALSFDGSDSAIGSDSLDFDGWISDSAWTGALEVTYHYAAGNQNVPEPGALALVGLALGALALSRRRQA